MQLGNSYVIITDSGTFGKTRAQFLALFLQRLKDQYLQQWHVRISANSKLTAYIGFKQVYEHEHYLNIITNRNIDVSYPNQVRISAHDLEVERGWYSGIGRRDRCDRICKLCRREVESFCLN